MNPRERIAWALGAAAVGALATVPYWLANEYALSLMISVLMYGVLASAWALFSGPTRYISLATVAFFGLGAYTTAVLGESIPWAGVLAVALALGVGIALVVGLATLRLSGVYFVIFSFGLAELTKQLVTWYEVNITREIGRYVFVDITQQDIYWQLLTLLALAIGLRAWLDRSRAGLALRVIGEDETVAVHVGINTTVLKVLLFALSAGFMSVAGAVMAPRWTYIDPAIAFAPVISFQTLIMALLGGASALFGPLLGAVPLVLLFEFLSAQFPNHYPILLGLVFLLIVYLVPNGIAGLLAQLRKTRTGTPHTDSPAVAAPTIAPLVQLPPTLTAQAANTVTAQGNGLPLLHVKGVTRRFGGLVAVNGLDLIVMPGEVIGLLGPNGSGKTTAMNLISGALRCHAGSIALLGRRIDGESSHRIARLGVARTFQLVRVLGGMRCVDNIVAGLSFRPHAPKGAAALDQARALLARVGLASHADTLACDLTYIDQKRLELARALALEPKLLLLDEWLAGLNPTELQQGIALVRSLAADGMTIVLVEHVMDAVHALCTRCVVMNAGVKIADGPTDAVLRDPRVIEAYLGTDVDTPAPQDAQHEERLRHA